MRITLAVCVVAIFLLCSAVNSPTQDRDVVLSVNGPRPLLYVAKEPGQDARHVHSIWPLSNLFDLIPEGRGTQWHPEPQYDNLVSLAQR